MVKVTILSVVVFVVGLIGCENSLSPTKKPLDGRVFLSAAKSGSEVYLSMRTEEMYGCMGYEIDVDLICRSNFGIIDLKEAVLYGETCATAMSPAYVDITFNGDNDKYYVIINYQGKPYQFIIENNSECNIVDDTSGMVLPVDHERFNYH